LPVKRGCGHWLAGGKGEPASPAHALSTLARITDMVGLIRMAFLNMIVLLGTIVSMRMAGRRALI
jgi:hypothetical protein